MADRPSRRTVVAGSVLGVIVLYAVLVPLFAPPDADVYVDFAQARRPPSWDHVFGTDASGHDLFLRAAQGLRISLLIALVTSVLSAALGLVLGVVAGAFGGWWDRIIMRALDALNSLPSLLVGLLIVAMFRGSVTAIILSLVITHWTSVARVVRTQVLSLRGAEYVQAARLGGRSETQIAARHLLPVALGQTLVGFTLLIPHTIWHESTLSFLGVGLPPHRASLGTLLSDAEASLLLGDWWQLVVPAGLLIVVTLAIAALGNALLRATRVDGDLR